MSVPIHDSGLLALSVPLLENMKQKKKKEGTHHHVILWILSSLTLCLLLSIFSLPICVLYIVSRFFSCSWQEGIGKNTSTPSSQIYFHIINKKTLESNTCEIFTANRMDPGFLNVEKH